MKELVINVPILGFHVTAKLLNDSGALGYKGFDSACTRNSLLNIIDNPFKKRGKIVAYDSLPFKNKEKIKDFLRCEPKEYFLLQPIKNLIEKDWKAESFFRPEAFRLNVNDVNEFVAKHTEMASVLNMLIKMQDDKPHLKKLLNIYFTELLDRVCEIIKSDHISLPTKPRILRFKINDYRIGGYESLIHKGFKNKNSAKIGKGEDGYDSEIAENQFALIRLASSKHQNFKGQQITDAVNKVFEQNGWPTVSKETVGIILKKYKHLTTPGSRGKREYNNKFAMQAIRKRPEFPLYHLSLDGWTVELLYQENNTYHNRLVMVVVLDTMNDYPLGYAIGDRENTDLIRQANRNAMYHIQELFGDYYQPRQLQSDHYGIKNLTPFYQSIAKLHTPAAVGNAKAKPIEGYFNRINNNYFKYFQNWSGHNLDSKKSNQPNAEFLDKIKQSFPDKKGVIEQIHLAMREDRKMKVQEYISKWAMINDADKLTLNKEDMLMIFGQPTGFTNSITGRGLVPTIEGKQIVYDSFDPAFRELHYLKFQVVYDKDDLTNILAISEDNKHRFLLGQKRILPMDIHSMNAEDHAYLSKINAYKKEQVNKVIESSINDNKRVAEVIGNRLLNPTDFDEAKQKLMFTTKGQQKEALQDAKGLKRIQNIKQKEIASVQKMNEEKWRQTQQRYNNSKVDLSAYFDELK
ncbi:MAG: hypothetical protein WKF85_06590 [Chitinophagaceae bacterium]